MCRVSFSPHFFYDKNLKKQKKWSDISVASDKSLDTSVSLLGVDYESITCTVAFPYRDW